MIIEYFLKNSFYDVLFFIAGIISLVFSVSLVGYVTGRLARDLLFVCSFLTQLTNLDYGVAYETGAYHDTNIPHKLLSITFKILIIKSPIYNE